MPFTPLYAVTSTLITVLKKYLEPMLGPDVKVVAQSPDKVPDDSTPVISVYLYHAREDAHFKNVDVPGGTVTNTPLALSLYYVVTAHRTVDEEPEMESEQNYLGYALKTFHDNPIITKNTEINSTFVLDSALGDNTVQIIYRPLTPEDAATFWNGDDSRLIRFSAFYEVRVVFLEPEPVQSLPGYVLSVGNYVLPTGVMAITASEGIVRFTPPGGAPVTLVASPARVALSGAIPPVGEPPNNQLTLRGTRLGGGQLVLRSPLFTTPNNQIAVVPANNPTWEISVTANRLVARIRKDLVRPDGTPQTLLPGIYGASIQVTTQYQLPGGLTKTLVARSNEVAIAVTPFIETHVEPIDPDPPPAEIEIHADAETILDAPELAAEISVVVEGQVYTENAALGIRQFDITDTSEFTIGAHFTADDPGIYPVRLIVRGAEAPPYWIVVSE